MVDSAAGHSSAVPVTAVVLSYNKRDYTRLCLEGLLRTGYGSLQIVVVDNGSTDGSVEMIEALARRAGNIRLVRNDANRGAPGARNQGMEYADGEYALFIDNDAVPFNSTWLPRMVDGIRTLPHAGAVSARLLFPFPPHAIQFAGCGISPSGRVQYIGRGAAREDAAFQGDRECQCLISACLMMPAQLVRDAGGFDEAFNPVQYEDLDLCYRIKELGYRCYVIGGAEVYHFENTTTDGSGDINFKYVTIKNGLLFKQRWKSRFAEENGPADHETAWLPLERRTLADLGADWSPT